MRTHHPLLYAQMRNPPFRYLELFAGVGKSILTFIIEDEAGASVLVGSVSGICLRNCFVCPVGSAE